jgi:hypothetical protein
MQATIQTNLKHFYKGTAKCCQSLVPTRAQIQVALEHKGTLTLTNGADAVWFTKMAETIYKAQTQEEAMVQELLEQWMKSGHGFVPEEKWDDIIRLGCEHVNSLNLFHPAKSKLKKLLNLHNKYQTDGACILEHGTNFCMAPNGYPPDNLFSTLRGTQVAAAHNIHEQHIQYQ